MDSGNAMLVGPSLTTTPASSALQGFVVAPNFYTHKEADIMCAYRSATCNTHRGASAVRKHITGTRYRQQESPHFLRGGRVVKGRGNVLSGSSGKVGRKNVVGFTLYMGVADSGAELGLDLTSGLGARMGSFVDGTLCLEKEEIGWEALHRNIQNITK